MKRPVGVILTAIFAILGSLLVGLFLIFEAVLFVRPPQGVAMPEQARIGLLFGVAMFGVLTVWGITTGIGLLRLKNWARISQLIFSAMMAGVSLISVPVMLLVPAPPNVPAAQFALGMKIAAGFYAFLGLLGVAWFVYFLRPKVKAAFAGADVVRSGRPLSLSIIGWWLLVSGLFCLPAAFLRFPLMLGGFVFKGASAMTGMFILGAIYVWVGYGILDLKPLARSVGIGLFLFFGVNGLLMAVWPGSQERFLEAMQSNPLVPPNSPPMPFNPMVFMWVSIPIMAIPLWFLIKEKAAFYSHGEPPQPTAPLTA